MKNKTEKRIAGLFIIVVIVSVFIFRFIEILEPDTSDNFKTYPVNIVKNKHWPEIQAILASSDGEKPSNTSEALENLNILFGKQIFKVSKFNYDLVVFVHGVGGISHESFSGQNNCYYRAELNSKNELVLVFEKETVELGLCNFNVVQTDVGNAIFETLKYLDLSKEKLESMSENKKTFPVD